MRNIKMLGLLAVSAMALVAFVGTTSASATAFTSGGAGEALKHTTTQPHVFTITGAEVECETINFTGTTTAPSAGEQKVNPSYDNCSAFGFAEAEVHENGCEFTFKAATTGSPGHATVLLHGCGTGTDPDKTKGIQITVHVPFFATCVVDVPEQSVDTAVRYTNDGVKAVTVDITANKVMADVTTSTGFCPLTPGTHSGANGGTYKGQSTITTTNGVQYSP
jgi:hypothetical protein